MSPPFHGLCAALADTVNTASRMESTGAPHTVHVSQDTRDLLPNETFRPTGGVHVKGKGVMPTFTWDGMAGNEEAQGQLQRVLGLYL